MYNKNNLIEHNTNFNASQFRRVLEANNKYNNFRERLFSLSNDHNFI